MRFTNIKIFHLYKLLLAFQKPKLLSFQKPKNWPRPGVIAVVSCQLSAAVCLCVLVKLYSICLFFLSLSVPAGRILWAFKNSVQLAGNFYVVRGAYWFLIPISFVEGSTFLISIQIPRYIFLNDRNPTRYSCLFLLQRLTFI